MQETNSKVYTVKEVAKIYTKMIFKIWQLWQRHKTKIKRGYKRCKFQKIPYTYQKIVKDILILRLDKGKGVVISDYG